MRRLIAMLSFSCLLLWPWTTRSLPRPDVVIGSTVHPFAAFAAWLLSCCYGVPFVFEVRDLWPRTLVAMGAIKSGSLTEGFFSFLERRLAHRAAFSVVLMPGAINYYQRFEFQRSFALLPNGAEIPIPNPSLFDLTPTFPFGQGSHNCQFS